MADPAEGTDKKEIKDTNKEIVEYAITITFKRLHCKSPFGQFKETAPFLTKLLNRSCTFELYPEWRHTTGDIHYHGNIIIKDHIKWFKQTLPSLKCQGFILIKKIDNKDKWDKYIKKEMHIAKGLLPDQMTLPINKEVQIIKSKNKRTIVIPTMNIVEKLDILPEIEDIEISDSE